MQGFVGTIRVEPYPKSDGKLLKDDTGQVAYFTVLLPQPLLTTTEGQ